MGEAGHGRRDNGLVASEYAAAGDVDPRVGEHVLDLLARDGIAAYLRPSSDLHPVTRSTILPKRPTDRLFVDRAHVATARDHLDRLAREERETEAALQKPPVDPGAEPPDGGTHPATGRDPGAGASVHADPSAEEVDRAFAEIVAGFGTTSAPATAGPDGTASAGVTWRDPTSPPRPDAAGPREPVRPDPARGEPEPAEERSLLDGLDTLGADLPDEDPGEFVPPDPPPVPRPSLPTVLAVIGVVAGLAVFLKPSLLSFLSESLAMFLGFASVVGGFAALVWRLRPGNDDDEPDPDHGARV